jgi:hypothetical protein
VLDLPDFPCYADPNPNAPTLNSHDVIYGNLISHDPLGTVVHNSVVRGNVIQDGGGAGLGCVPVGIFNKYFGLPDYTDYSNTTVGGNLVVNGLDTCWMGMMRNRVGSNMLVTNDIGPADAQEVVTNRVYGNMICTGNHAAVEFGDSNGKPNEVAGTATGQCRSTLILPNPAYHDGVECPPCQRTWEPISVKLR